MEKKKLTVQNTVLFTRQNFIIMAAGLAVMALGFFLMAGGNSSDPKSFDPNEVYSFTRITVAPALIIIGLIVEIYAIMKGPVKKEI